jgi:Mg2+-importing ATPase
MLSVLGASIFLPFLPMAPIQVLTNNLLYDFSQTTIPTDNVDHEYIAAPRRWDIGNITRFMLFLGPISSIFDYVTYAALLFVFDAWNNPALFQTGWFVESLLTQTLIIHIIRTANIPFLQSRASNALIATTILVAGAGAPFLFPIGPDTRLRTFAGSLLVGCVFDYPRLLRAGAPGQDMVRPPLGVVINTYVYVGSFPKVHS